jgi:PAS domain S-box-containing protein
MDQEPSEITREPAGRERAETKLLQLSRAVEQSPSSVVITDARGRIEYVNPKFTRLTGYTLEEVLGKNPRILKSGDMALEGYKAMWKTITTGGEWRGELHNRKKNGDYYWEFASISPILDEHGVTTHFVAVKEDITERKEAEAELKETHRKLVEASRRAGMAEVAVEVLHNVGNLLNSVNVSANLVIDRIGELDIAMLGKAVALLEEHSADLGSFLTHDSRGRMLPGFLIQFARQMAEREKLALAELQSLCNHLDQIKGFVAMQQGYTKAPIAAESTSIAELAEESLRICRETLAQAKIRVVREYHDVPSVNVDRHKILPILVNLVLNAQHACVQSGRDDGLLNVRLIGREGRIRISVTDNGIGIPAENLRSIFVPRPAHPEAGRGFSLHRGALAAQEMGGLLLAHSDGPGRGAVFTLELPVR